MINSNKYTKHKNYLKMLLGAFSFFLFVFCSFFFFSSFYIQPWSLRGPATQHLHKTRAKPDFFHLKHNYLYLPLRKYYLPIILGVTRFSAVDGTPPYMEHQSVVKFFRFLCAPDGTILVEHQTVG